MNQDIRELEIEVEKAKAIIDTYEALVRLEKNKDFKKVILDGYLKEFALNTVLIRGRMEFRSNATLLESNTRKLDSIGELAEYFRNLRGNAAQMRNLLAEAESTREEILSEED